jgi:hypothetical protein
VVSTTPFSGLELPVDSDRVLRPQADDLGVLELTAQAMAEPGSPPLTFVCSQCGHRLARAGITPSGRLLFTSSWEVPAPQGEVVTVNGEQLGQYAARKFIKQNTEPVSESGKPVDSPLKHYVAALLILPRDVSQDFPDLIVRCGRHYDAVLNRIAVVKRLRAVRPNRDEKQRITLRRFDTEDGHLVYRSPIPMPGRQKHTVQSETRQFRFDVMPLEEFERRNQQRYRRT